MKERLMVRTLVFLTLVYSLASLSHSDVRKTRGDKESTSATLIQSVGDYGDLNPETFSPDPGSREALGVRVGRVIRRDELPGGPWATGEIGDYILENSVLRVIVKNEKRSGLSEMAGAGCIADVVLRDQMWDSFGGVIPLLKVNGDFREIVYDSVQIKPARDPVKTPFLLLYGHAKDFPGINVITTMYPEPDKPHLVVSTLCLNEGRKNAEVEVLERVQWGTLPVFVSSFGIPKPSQTMEFSTRWICGILDDYCLAEVTETPKPLDVVRLQQNMSIHLLLARTLAPNTVIEAKRTFIVSRGDMAPVSEYALKAKEQRFGWIEGIVTQVSDSKPLPGAEVEIRMFNPRERESTGNYAYPPYALTLTDQKGHYQIAAPVGDFAIQARTLGRPLVPFEQAASRVEPDKTVKFNIDQMNASSCTLEVVEVYTSAPMPAKVSFTPIGDTGPLFLGAPWRAQGLRSACYLRPGKNEIALPAGDFKCVFSRGPEYTVVEREIHVVPNKSQSVRVALQRTALSPGMISVDVNLPTRASPCSRVSPQDLVLAAAGEGVECIFSGDLNQVTDLAKSIAELKLGKWIRAFAGVHLSYQYPKLFGEFYVFPVPTDTTPATLKKLAGRRTRPAEFFKAVRKAFPGALIAVMQPSYKNISYLMYYNMDMTTGKSPFVDDFSLDFDALEVFEGKATQVNAVNWQMMEDLLRHGQPKIPLASSRSTDLYYEEVGYPRMYVVVGQDNPRIVSEQDIVGALRKGKYFITNGPIIEHAVLTDPKVCEAVFRAQQDNVPVVYWFKYAKLSVTNMDIRDQGIHTFWPTTRMSLPKGEMVDMVQVTAAPWVRATSVLFKESGQSIRQFYFKPSTEKIRFPTDADSRNPYLWSLHNTDRDTKEQVYRDAFVTVEVRGQSLAPVLTRAPHGIYETFAITPPILLDGDNDGRLTFRDK